MSDGKLFRAIRIKWSLALGAVTLVAIVSPIFAGTITVRSGADAGGTCPGASCTLRQAIIRAGSGDTINFSLPANSAITLTTAELLINKNLTISGPGANQLSVQRSTAVGTPAFRIFEITSGSVTLSGLTIANGAAINDYGGGVRNHGATVSITNTAISGNTGKSGGVYNTGNLTITNSTISGNTAAGLGSGGGIFNLGTLTIINTTISGNATTGYGGGIFNNVGTVTITKSTISGNSAPQGHGGGLYDQIGTMTITNSTITANSAQQGGGIAIFSSTTLNARNTIIARNTSPTGPDVSGALTSQGFNVIGNSSGATISPTEVTDQIGVDPLLGPLQDNSGPAFTHALLSGSTAIDKGHSSGSTTDQRGFARPVDDPAINNTGDGSDIGAYEVQSCDTINGVVKNNNDSGTDSLRAIINTVCVGSTITFAENVRGAINLTSGELLINKSLTINGPGANLLSVQRNIALDASPFYRIFNLPSASSNVSISGLTITGGSKPGASGGGIYSLGNLTLNKMTIAGNSALGGAGGGIYNAGTSFITNSTISGNTVNSTIVAGSGGGLFNFGAILTITNSTFSGNSAIGPANQTPDHGGALYTNVGSVTFTNSTITANRSDNGGGVLAENGGVINLRNTIIALNTSPSGPDFKGEVTSQGFNLIGDFSGTFHHFHPTDQLDVTAAQLHLGPLQDNGGPTQTHALLPGSFALDKGDSSDASSDQRGFARVVDLSNIANANGGDGSDIGAFEFASAQLSNISTRVRVLTGDKVLIGGFIVTGSAPKKIIIRAIGPSLTSFGVAGALADPILELHKPGNIVVTNDNWKTTQQAVIQATGIAPKNDLESAIVATLAPGNYTAIVRGKNNGIGVGLVEAYDLDQAAASQLGNISTRGFVDTGENVMIGGIIVGPTGAPSGKMLIRAIGPSLASSGIAGPLADPTLELHNGNGVLTASNDNWKTSQQAVIQATGIPPTNDKESAILATLAPGNYTAIVRGKNNITGVALVEVYSLVP